MIVTSTICPLLKFGLRIFGFWPDVPFAFVRQLIYVLAILPIQYFQYRYIFAIYKRGDMEELAGSLPEAVYYSLTGLKVMIVWKHQRIIHELLAIVDTDWHECVKVDQYLHIMMTKASLSKFCTHIMTSFCMGTTIFYFGGNTFYTFIKILQGYNVTSRPFPIKLLLPFNAELSPTYELVALLLYLHSLSITYMVVILSSLLFTLIFHACGQIEILCEELKAISEKTFNNEFVAYTIKMLIEGHNKVNLFSENIEKLFSYIALVQIFGNIIIICFLGLVIMTSDTTAFIDQIKLCCACIGIWVEIFIYCSVGELLCYQSKSLGDAGYNSLWYNMSPSHGKNILLIILRSQRQLTITAGGITVLSLEAFTSIMKAAASYMSVLNAMY